MERCGDDGAATGAGAGAGSDAGSAAYWRPSGSTPVESVDVCSAIANAGLGVAEGTRGAEGIATGAEPPAAGADDPELPMNAVVRKPFGSGAGCDGDAFAAGAELADFRGPICTGGGGTPVLGRLAAGATLGGRPAAGRGASCSTFGGSFPGSSAVRVTGLRDASEAATRLGSFAAGPGVAPEAPFDALSPAPLSLNGSLASATSVSSSLSLGFTPSGFRHPPPVVGRAPGAFDPAAVSVFPSAFDAAIGFGAAPILNGVAAGCPAAGLGPAVPLPLPWRLVPRSLSSSVGVGRPVSATDPGSGAPPGILPAITSGGGWIAGFSPRGDRSASGGGAIFGAGATSVVPSVGISWIDDSLDPSSGTVNAGTQPGIPSRHTSVDGASTLLASAERSSSARTTRCTP